MGPAERKSPAPADREEQRLVATLLTGGSRSPFPNAASVLGGGGCLSLPTFAAHLPVRAVALMPGLARCRCLLFSLQVDGR